MNYDFYGWKTADIKDSLGLTPRDYYTLLSRVWCAETCAPRMRQNWSPANKALGQCSITAFLMQDFYGGKVMGIPLGDGNFHCFNQVGDCVFDLTSEQFDGQKLDYSKAVEQDRSVHFAKTEKLVRYELLKASLAFRPVQACHIQRYSQIYAAAFSGESWHNPWTPEDAEIHVQEIMDSPKFYGLEYVEDGKILGLLLGTSMLFHYGRVFEISDIAVDPSAQGHGIAGLLLEHCKADMVARGVKALHLITNTEGHLPAFYEQHGFRSEHRVMLMGMDLT